MVGDLGQFEQVALYLLGVGAVYGGIRADLKNMRLEIEDMRRELKRAHKRIDRNSRGEGDGKKR